MVFIIPGNPHSCWEALIPQIIQTERGAIYPYPFGLPHGGISQDLYPLFCDELT